MCIQINRMNKGSVHLLLSFAAKIDAIVSARKYTITPPPSTYLNG